MKISIIKISIIGVWAAALSFAGCATVVTSPSQQIKVESNPPGAKIIVAEKVPEVRGKKDSPMIFVKRRDGGVTPATVSVHRRNGAILLELPGYETAEVPLKAGMNPWLLGDVALGSLLSTSIDSSTGAMYRYDPGQYMIELKKKPE